jgi:hypothetical protein
LLKERELLEELCFSCEKHPRSSFLLNKHAPWHIKATSQTETFPFPFCPRREVSLRVQENTANAMMPLLAELRLFRQRNQWLERTLTTHNIKTSREERANIVKEKGNISSQ